jgi:hypothetical protein
MAGLAVTAASLGAADDGAWSDATSLGGASVTGAWPVQPVMRSVARTMHIVRRMSASVTRVRAGGSTAADAAQHRD